MERQRSFSVKSTSFIALSLTVSTSLVFFAFFSIWTLRSSPAVLPPGPTFPSFNRTPTPIAAALPANTTTSRRTVSSSFHSLSGRHHPVGNISSKAPILIDTRVVKTENSSGSPEANAGRPTDGIEALSWRKGASSDEVAARDCDFRKGKWVYDESYPLYRNWTCPFIDEGFDCGGNGRPDNGYSKWRWQPLDCPIPRFNATAMLEMIRGKRLVFVGDSMDRNQWESMMCLLIGAVGDPKKVYESRGRRITKENVDRCVHCCCVFVCLKDYKCTVEYYVTHFLVHESKARVGRKRVQTLRLDSVDRGSSRWRGADILVFNTAHWWSHYKTKAGINYYQEGNQVHPKLNVSTAFRKALMTWGTWVDSHVDPRKTRVFFRSSSPSHFSGGEWNSGGHCREAKLPLNATSRAGYDSEKNSIAEDVIMRMKTPVTLLDITGLSGYRIDAHPSAYGGRQGKARSGIEDCSHWCLPGVPDSWNELLYVHLQRQMRQRRGTA